VRIQEIEMLRTILVIAAVSLSSISTAWALKIVGQPETSFELTLAGVTLPESASGAVRFRTCETCAVQALSVTRATKYFVDSREVTLDDFALTAAGIREQPDAAEGTFVGLYVDIASQRVNRIALSRLR
jgi:hypothetical protein